MFQVPSKGLNGQTLGDQLEGDSLMRLVQANSTNLIEYYSSLHEFVHAEQTFFGEHNYTPQDTQAMARFARRGNRKCMFEDPPPPLT